MGNLARIAAPLVVAVACTNLGDLSGGPTDNPQDAAVTPESGGPDAACAPEAKTDPANCCGRVCPVRANAFPTCNDGVCGIGCNKGTASCDGDDANGCETDTSNAVHACGACGHDCLGGACQSGACKPFTLASGMNQPTELALDANRVYISDSLALNGRIYSCPLAGCGSTETLLATAEDAPSQIAVDATSVYWVSGGFSANNSIRKCALTGCNGLLPAMVATSQHYVVGLGVSGPWVYWAIYDASGGVRRAHLDGSAQEVVVGGVTPSSATYDGTHVYFENVDADGGGFRSCPIATCNGGPGTLLSPANGIYAFTLAVDSTRLYAAANGVIGAVAIAGGDAGPISPPQGEARHVATRGDDVYWTDSSAGTLNRYAKSTGAISVVASGLASPQGVVLDDKAIYFANKGDGTVMLLAR